MTACYKAWHPSMLEARQPLHACKLREASPRLLNITLQDLVLLPSQERCKGWHIVARGSTPGRYKVLTVGLSAFNLSEASSRFSFAFYSQRVQILHS